MPELTSAARWCVSTGIASRFLSLRDGTVNLEYYNAQTHGVRLCFWDAYAQAMRSGRARTLRLQGGGDVERVDCNPHSRRAYAVLAGKRWYIGYYADCASGEAAAHSFLREMHRSNSNDDAFAMAALAQKAARHSCLGRHGFDQWRDGSAEGRHRELYANWKAHDALEGIKSQKIFLGSFRTEIAARVALDSFLSTADRNVEAALAAAKQVAAEETTNIQQFAAPEDSSYIASCIGWIPQRKKLRISFAGDAYELGRFRSADAARPASLLFLQARATKDLEKVRCAAEECLRMSAENLATSSCAPSACAEPAPGADNVRLFEAAALLDAGSCSAFQTRGSAPVRVEPADAVGGGDEAGANAVRRVARRTRAHGVIASLQDASTHVEDPVEDHMDVSCNKEGAEQLWRLMKSDHHGGGLLADEMGLGKTLTVLLLLWRALREGVITSDRPALVVIPPRILHHWQAEVVKWAPLFQWHSLRDAVTTVDVALLQPATGKAPLRSAVHFLTYQSFTHPVRFADLATYSYHTVVFDEARGLEDPTSRTAQHLERLRMFVGARPRTRELPLFVLAVLGTPFGGSLANAANLLTTLDPDRPVAAVVREVAAAFGAMTVRRMLSDRCEVHRTLVCVPLNRQQREAYVATLRAALAEGLSPHHSIAVAFRTLSRICQFAHPAGVAEQLPYCLLTYRQLLAGSSKLHYFDAFLRKAMGRSARVLVFAFSKAAMALLQAYVKAVTSGYDGVDAGLLDQLGSAPVPFVMGNAPSALTEEAVRWFEQPVDARRRRSRLMVLSAIAGGRGLNLPSADHVFLFEPMQSQRVDNQTVARALRRTRSASTPLQVYQTIAVDTVEHGQHIALWAKAALAEAVPTNLHASRCEGDGDEQVERGLKCRLLEGGSLLHLNDYAFGIAWHKGSNPSTAGSSDGRDLTDQLDQVVCELQRGRTSFEALECRRLLGAVCLTQADFVRLRPKPFGCVWQWSPGGRPCRGRLLVHQGLIAAMSAKQTARAPVDFSAAEWSAFNIDGLRRDSFVELKGSFYQPLEQSVCWLYPSDSCGHDLVGAYATLVRDYARKPLCSSPASGLSEYAEWSASGARDEAYQLLRSSLTLEAIVERRKHLDADRQLATAAVRQSTHRVVSSPSRLRSGSEFGRHKRRRTSGVSSSASPAPPPHPNLVAVPALEQPDDPLQLKGLFVECQFYMDRPSRWVLFAGVVAEVNRAAEAFTVSFEHEALLRLPDSSRVYLLSDLYENPSYIRLVARERAVELWRARARALDADRSLNKARCFSKVLQRRPSDVAVINQADSLQQATEVWLQTLERGVRKRADLHHTECDAHNATLSDSRMKRRSELGLLCTPGMSLAEGTPVAVWWSEDHTKQGRVLLPDWYVGRVQLVVRANGRSNAKQVVQVLYEDGNVVYEPLDALRLWHGLCKGECEVDQLELTHQEAEAMAELCDGEYALNLDELNLVEEEDLEDDLAVIHEVNAFNLTTMQRAIDKQTKGGVSSGRAMAGLARNMVYDCDITADVFELLGRRLSAAERIRCSDIAIGPKALRAAVQGTGGGGHKVARSYHVPRKLSLLAVDALSAGCRGTLAHVNTLSVTSSKHDSFTTLLLHLPATEVIGLRARGPKLPAGKGELLHSAAAVWVDAAPCLRRMAFDLHDADCFVPSRGTSQFFGGFDANPHKAEAILRQAMAVHRGQSFVAGVQHADLRVPTCIAMEYVVSGLTRLGEWLSPLCLARAKHKYVTQTRTRHGFPH